MDLLLIIIILVVVIMIIGSMSFINNKNKGKVRYIFSSPQGEKIVTNWKTFDQGEYDTIVSVHTHPEEVTHITTDHKGIETIVSIPFILNGFIQLERR